MKTTTMIYAAVFVAAMLGSYFTWTKAPEPVDEGGGTILIDVEPTGLKSVAFASEEIDVLLEQRADKLGEFTWVTTTRRVDPKKPNPHAAAPVGADGVQKLAFKAGKAGTQLIDELAPFRVTRELEVTDDDLEKFGLDDPKSTLTVTPKSGKARTFEIGDTAYGHKNIYAREKETGKVYVIKRTLVTPLERADSRLPDKELFAGPVSLVKGATVSIPTGEKLPLVQRNRDDASAATWTAVGSETANPTADAWLDKMFRLRSTAYVPTDAQMSTEPVVTLALDIEDSAPVTLRIYRGADSNGEEAWYASSEYTRGMVLLSKGLAADAAADVATLFGAAEQ